MNYLTTEEAAKILGLSDRSVIRQYLSTGLLKGKKFGKVWLVSKKSVLDRKERLTTDTEK